MHIDDDKGYMVNMLLTPLKKYTDDEQYSEIMINKPGEVCVNGIFGTEIISESEITEKLLDDLTRAIAVYNKTKEGIINYFVLPDGNRCTVIKNPASFNGYYGFIIRKFMAVEKTIEEIIEQGAFENTKNAAVHVLDENSITNFSQNNNGLKLDGDDELLLRLLLKKDYKEFLKNAVLMNKNIVFSGATASGKTTIMRSIIEFIPKHERIITIEDVHELKMDNFPNKLPLIFGRGEGQISSQQLLEACMRATPDRILLAELRGVETWDYLQSLNTGHPGSITSVHASSAFRAFMRIATLANQSAEGRALGFEVIKDVVYNTIDIVIQMKRRKVTEIFFDPLFIMKRLNQN